jgi:predicted dienelactone hydrolase
MAGGAHPVVVFTPGYTGTFTDYTFLLEDLASRGYVVASVDHTYEATIVEFPDGTLIKSAVGSHFANTWRLDDETLSVVMATRQADLSFMINELDRLNATSGSPFGGRLDPARIGIMGHSLGGAAALSALQQDSRFKAAVLFDGAIADESVIPMDSATLILAMGCAEWEENECGLWNNIAGPHLAVNLRGDEHLTASDAVWLAKGAIQTGSMGPERTIAAIRD